MPLDDEAKKRLNGTLSAMKAMVERGSVDDEWYYKALVTGAHECLYADDFQRATELLGKVPPEYYETTLAVHMELDPVFADQAYEVAEVLVYHGMVHVGFTEEEKANVKEV